MPVKIKAEITSEITFIVKNIKTKDKFTADAKNRFKTTGVVLKTTKNAISKNDLERKFPGIWPKTAKITKEKNK